MFASLTGPGLRSAFIGAYARPDEADGKPRSGCSQAQTGSAQRAKVRSYSSLTEVSHLMRVTTILACCALCVAGTALAQAPGSESQDRQTTQQRQTPQSERSQSSQTPSRIPSQTPSHTASQSRATTTQRTTQSDRTARESVPERQSTNTRTARRSPSAHRALPTRVARGESCTREADAQHLTGHRRTTFLAGCRPGAAPR